MGAPHILVIALAALVAAELEPTLPDVWTVVEGSYDSSVLVTFPSLTPGVSMLVDELYDIGEEQGVVEVIDHSQITKTNYYSKTQQAFVVKGNNCSVGSILDHDGYHFWGWIYDDSESMVGKQNFLYGPSALLRIVRDYSKETVYMGQTEIRGIIADHWVINHKKNYTLDYYFAGDEWLMPYGHTLDGINLKSPLQVTVHGLQGNPWNTSMADIEQTVFYDYIDFKPYVHNLRKKEFLVQVGLDCKGRETLDPSMSNPPDAPSMFEVFLETVVQPLNGGDEVHPLVFRAWMYYDSSRQLLRLDVNPDQDADQPHKSYKSIHDYTTGIEYQINLVNGECTMKALDPNQLGNLVGSSIISDVIMANPDNLFHLDDTYFFNGYGVTRALKTTRWTSTREDIMNPDTGEPFKKAVVDYQFLSEFTSNHGEMSGRPMPARVDVTVYRDNDTSSVLYHHTVNFLHMKTSFEVYSVNPFDVGECMDIPTQRTWVKITFDGKWLEGASQEPDEFKKILLNQISEETGTSPVRLPEVQLDHDLDLVFATVLLLEPAPYHLQFNHLEDRKPTENDSPLNVVIQDVDICALECLRYSKFTCKSFYQCTGLAKNCYVSNYKNSPGNFIDIPKNCSHYKKAIIKDTKIQKPNWEILLWLNSKIAERKLKIKIDYEDSEGQMQSGEYTAIAQEEQLLGDDPILVDLVRDDYHLASKQSRLKNKYTDQTLNKVSYAACLLSCSGQMAFKCEAFSYCYSARSCFLSSHVVKIPVPITDVIRKTDCVIISRSHIDDYNKIDGTVYLGEPNEKLEAFDSETCAYYCDTATDYTCRSFDFCNDEGTCNLYDQHSLNVPDDVISTSNPDCVHYSRNALVDFVKHDKQVLAGNRDRYVKSISTTRCAQVCEDEPGFGCNGFDYCNEAGDITCFLTSAHYSDAGVVISNSPSCDHYSREYYEGSDRNSFAHHRKSSYIYGPGDMAGLACSMLIISIGLTFAGVYAYNKYYKK
ncbi:uncharacterized protein [Panulirus ornatus]|uniref:uncharacterized protein n=1 Tax=Panulirus ornatus TaxID=150431 RepID=UPI003A89770F